MKTLPLPTHPIEKFTFTGGQMVADASDLGGPMYGQIYEDACDMGLDVHNPVSGNTARFLFSHAIEVEEDEVQGWVFYPSPKIVRVFPKLAGVKLVILND